MGLRKLTDKPTSQADRLARAEHDAAEVAVRRYQDGQRPSATPHAETTVTYTEDTNRSTATDLQTPPPSRNEFGDEVEMISLAPAAPAAQTPPIATPPTPAANSTPAPSTDSFAAALEALRATLRQPAPAQGSDSKLDPASKPDVASKSDSGFKLDRSSKADAAPAPPVAEVSAPIPMPNTPIEKESNSGIIETPPMLAEEPASALERMPLPPPVEGPTQTPRPLYEDPLLKVQRRKTTPVIEPAVSRETPTMDTALQAVRNAVPGLRLTPPKSDTPTNGRETPLSDGMPKSVSEDLPKYTARPKMRICGRCGHETKLRNVKCEKCAHVDESLGILDAVIAGDIVRVEQVLLVRPGLITLRTSRHEWTLLHMAASGGNPKMVDLLLTKGASVNATNRDGKTALHYAAGKGHVGIVKTLLSHHADPTMLYNGRSALDLARKAGHHEAADVIRAVMPEGDPNAEL